MLALSLAEDRRRDPRDGSDARHRIQGAIVEAALPGDRATPGDMIGRRCAAIRRLLAAIYLPSVLSLICPWKTSNSEAERRLT